MRKEGKKMANEDNVFAGSIESLESVAVKEAWGVEKKIVFGPRRFWKDYVMRHFQLDKGAQTPLHTHDWPHINYIVEGRGVLHVDGRDTPIESGSYAFVPAGSTHQFSNTGSEKFRFICIVPTEGYQF